MPVKMRYNYGKMTSNEAMWLQGLDDLIAM